MKTKATLNDYVKKRNGVALGHRDSLKNMLRRSFGAGSFRGFWKHWNPIWGYYLSRSIMKPLNLVLSTELAALLTFTVSGAIHDVAISLINDDVYIFFTPWFILMGLYTLLEAKFRLAFDTKSWLFNASLNLVIISVCFGLTQLITSI